MRFWSYCISADPLPDLESGFVQAATAAEAVSIVGHQQVNVYELPEGWEPEVGDRVLTTSRRVWSIRS